MSYATPIRQHGTRTAEGWVLLRDIELAYLDGAEERTLQLLRSSTDISSTSDELVERATDWTERYNVHPGRANVVRAFELPESATVLEVGAGCGPVTRYLGERCAVVDALEPVPERARVARERTRDLPNVEVFVGDLDDVPPVPAYDIVVVVGVLEWSSGGTANPEPYVAFLSKIRQVLRPGGTVILAIENKLGVKYLAGAAEDHTGRPFDGVEGYPAPARARTFSRAELEALFDAAGLSARTRIAFPDYKLTRTVLEPGRVPEGAASLLHRIPTFPSPDWFGTSVAGADERLLWTSLCEAGLADETGNSFVVVASPNTDALSDRWPEDRAGIYFTPDRRSSFSVTTDVRVQGTSVRFDRAAQPNHREIGGFHVEVGPAEYVPGRDLLDEFVDVDDERSSALLQQWVDLVADRAPADRTPTDGTPIDLVPHNLVVDPYGVVRSIDDEWRSRDEDGSALLERGALTLALRLGQRQVPPPGAWRGCATLRDVARRVGSTVGLPADGAWIDPALEREIEFQAAVTLPALGQTADTARELMHRAYVDALAAPFAAPHVAPEGSAVDEQLRREVARLEKDLHELLVEYKHVFDDLQEVLPEYRRVLAERADLQATVTHLHADAERDAELLARAGDSRAEASRRDAATGQLVSVLASRWWRMSAPVRLLERAVRHRELLSVRALEAPTAEIERLLGAVRSSWSWRVTHPGHRTVR